MQTIKARAVASLTARTLGLLMAVSSIVCAEKLPIKAYTTADGLAHNVVNQIVCDSRGFIWFCTREGLSRFDGYSFTNYGVKEGLPSALVNCLLETREGDYWVGTAGGLCRFNPFGKSQPGTNSISEGQNRPDAMFTVYFPSEDARAKHILSILEDGAGVIWCGTRNGLYRAEIIADQVNFGYVDLGIADYLESRSILSLMEDRAGALWVGTASGLYRRWPYGRVENYTLSKWSLDYGVHSLLEDREGRIWVGTRNGGVCRLVPDSSPSRSVVARVYSDKDGLPAKWINQLYQTADGTLWAGSNNGLIRFIPSGDSGDFRFRTFAQPHGLAYHEIAALAEDRNGNLWTGMLNGGAAKIARGGFTTFDQADGFFWSSSIFENRAGDLFVVGAPSGNTAFINQYDGEKFISIRPKFPEITRGFSWGWSQIALEDHTGEWWMAANGLCRFPKVSKPQDLAHTAPKAIYTTRDGLAADMILRLFEDSRGDIWISSVGEGKSSNGLSRWERATASFHHYSEKDNLPRLDKFYVSSFAEYRSGNLWLGFSGEGGLARYRNGGFTLFAEKEGVPAGQIRNLFFDSAGRLWVPSYRGGLSRIDNPAAEVPTFYTYTIASGLSSNEISGVTADEWGRIYIGTGRGIDRLEVATSRIRHYTIADGLPKGDMLAAWRDRQGALWFSFAAGLARLAPEPDPQPVAPPIMITGLRIAGEGQAISAFGQKEVSPVVLGANRNQVEIEFVALGFSSGEGLRYQYKLEGANEEWSELSEQRSVSFANLAAGSYRFKVRAVNAEGVMSEGEATFSFRVLPPVWQRWWFIALAAVLVGLIVYAMHRYRVARLIELERVRTRIATDLHDDIGSNLSQIALLSEVVRKQVGAVDPRVNERLSSIASNSRELVDSMSDIVWAVNPHRDRLSDLAQRMRRFADDMLSARNIALEFHGPEGDRDLKLGAETRREVFLILKESVNNIARHSECAEAEVDLRIEGGWLVLKVSDDGKGFDPTSVRYGNGLTNMRQRAKKLCGELEVMANNDRGTTLTLKVPL